MNGRGRIFTSPVLVAFVALAFPLVASLLNDDDSPNLTGIVIAKEKPALSRQAWFSGEYQKARDDYNDDHWAFKEKMVRLNNQLYYDLFNQLRVKGFVSGKENYVYSEDYIFSAFGDDLMPESRVKDLLRKAKVIQDSLARHHIDLLLVFAPGKGMGCREYVQDKYVHPFSKTNHDLFATESADLRLNVLDLYSWFEKLKPVAEYPLFPRFGHHWSYYGECLAVDTIIRHIEQLHGCDLPAFGWSEIEVSDTARSRDADVLKSMNLLHDPPQNMKLAYPKIEFGEGGTDSTKVLTVSDSYWYGPVYMGVPRYCFGNGQFWYYYNKIVPSPAPGVKVEVWELDLKKEIESNDVVMLLYSDGNLPTFGSGFIEEVYEMYTDPAGWHKRRVEKAGINSVAKQIRESPVLLKKATALSEKMMITLDSAVTLEARRMSGIN